jgi:hypothetical protein
VTRIPSYHPPPPTRLFRLRPLFPSKCSTQNGPHTRWLEACRHCTLCSWDFIRVPSMTSSPPPTRHQHSWLELLQEYCHSSEITAKILIFSDYPHPPSPSTAVVKKVVVLSSRPLDTRLRPESRSGRDPPPSPAYRLSFLLGGWNKAKGNPTYFPSFSAGILHSFNNVM